MKKIQVYGKEYPMRMTMGAMLRYKRESGQDVSLMGNDVSLMILFLFCCVTSACNADGVDFALDIDKFADGLDMNVLNDFAETLAAGNDTKKKMQEPLQPTSTN